MQLKRSVNKPAIGMLLVKGEGRTAGFGLHWNLFPSPPFSSWAHAFVMIFLGIFFLVFVLGFVSLSFRTIRAALSEILAGSRELLIDVHCGWNGGVARSETRPGFMDFSVMLSMGNLNLTLKVWKAIQRISEGVTRFIYNFSSARLWNSKELNAILGSKNKIKKWGAGDA